MRRMDPRRTYIDVVADGLIFLSACGALSACGDSGVRMSSIDLLTLWCRIDTLSKSHLCFMHCPQYLQKHHTTTHLATFSDAVSVRANSFTTYSKHTVYFWCQHSVCHVVRNLSSFAYHSQSPRSISIVRETLVIKQVIFEVHY